MSGKETFYNIVLFIEVMFCLSFAKSALKTDIKPCKHAELETAIKLSIICDADFLKANNESKNILKYWNEISWSIKIHFETLPESVDSSEERCASFQNSVINRFDNSLLEMSLSKPTNCNNLNNSQHKCDSNINAEMLTYLKRISKVFQNLRLKDFSESNIVNAIVLRLVGVNDTSVQLVDAEVTFDQPQIVEFIFDKKPTQDPTYHLLFLVVLMICLESVCIVLM